MLPRIAKHQNSQNPGIILTELQLKKLLRITQDDQKRILPHAMHVTAGTRIRLSQNIAVEIGLYHSALGTIRCFGYKADIPPSGITTDYAAHGQLREQPVIFIEMDHMLEGFSVFTDTPNIIALLPTTHKLTDTYERIQYPFVIAHGSTVHSMQGMTLKHGIVFKPPPKTFAGGLTFTGISRTPTRTLLLLLGHLTTNMFTEPFAQKRLIKELYAYFETQFPHAAKFVYVPN